MVVFLILAAVGLIYLSISVFVGDHEVSADLDHGGSGFLSTRSIAIFLTSFGTVGAIARWYDQAVLQSSLWGIIAGAAMIVVYVLAMGVVQSQQASSLIENDELVGLTGRVTVAIPAAGMGEISCSTKGQTTRRMARAADGQAFDEGAIVKIKETQGDLVIVEPQLAAKT